MIKENVEYNPLMDFIFSIIGIYFFVLLGFGAKHFFKEKIDQNTLVLISVYLLQPILTFWSLLQVKIDVSIATVPIVYLFVVVSFVFFVLVQRGALKDKKEKNILVATSIIGNTGNLGIPLELALYGNDSLIYTSLINIANVIVVYTVGVYYFSKGEASAKESLKNIIKLPILWFAFLALGLNYLDFSLSQNQNFILSMGAYACIVLQLMIFGIYFDGVRISNIKTRLQLFVNTNKLILLPLYAFGVVYFIDLEPMVKAIILLQLAMPLAVNNVNLASLYDSKPNEVASLIFVSSILFVVFVFIYMDIIGRF